MLYTNNFIINLKWRKCNNFLKRLIKGNVKYTKSLNFLFLFSLFHFTLRNYILSQHLKEFIMERLNYFSWESNLSIRPPRFFKYYLEVSMNTNQWERLSWKTAYSMILANNTKWVPSQLFGCDRGKLGPLGREHLHHLIFITKLLLVWPVGHMDPNRVGH